MAGRTLQAYINDTHVGEVRDENGVWSFKYDPSWIADSKGYPLSPALPKQESEIVDRSSVRPVQWYFDNLLPEEGSRQLLARDAKLDAADAFGLLAAYGAESAGSLTLVSGTPSKEVGERPLTSADLQKRIEQLPRVPLAHGSAKRMSLAGAQHKLAVVLRNQDLYEPIGATPSTHIIKPDNSDPDYPHTVINEYFTMRLASALGLDAPTVIRQYVPAPIYIIERFDRRVVGEGVERLHAIDACQALNLDRQFKYREGTVDRLRQLADSCTMPAVSRLKLFRWLVFNLLVGNSDAHLKNISFLVDARGITLAPFYDLLAVSVYGTRSFGKNEWPKVPMAFPISEATTFDEVNRKKVLDAGRALGLSTETAERQLVQLISRVDEFARAELAAISATNKMLAETDPDLNRIFGGENRNLRATIEVVVHDMARKLA